MKHYKIDDSATIRCSTSDNGCKGVIEFKPGEVYKFCSVCGGQKNKLRHGYSAYDYASVTAAYAKEHLANLEDEFYFMQDSKTNGAGHTILSVQRYYDMKISGYIDASKIRISFTEDTVSLDALCKEDGPWSTTVRYTTLSMSSFEIDERWMYEHTPEEFIRRAKSELRGLWCEPICKEKYDTIKKEIIAQNITELAVYNADDRIEKGKWKTPMSTMKLNSFKPNDVVKSLKRYANKQADMSEIQMFMQMKTGSEYALSKEDGIGDRGHLRMSMITNDKSGNRVGKTIVNYLPVPGESKQMYITGFDFYVD